VGRAQASFAQGAMELRRCSGGATPMKPLRPANRSLCSTSMPSRGCLAGVNADEPDCFHRSWPATCLIEFGHRDELSLMKG